MTNLEKSAEQYGAVINLEYVEGLSYHSFNLYFKYLQTCQRLI